MDIMALPTHIQEEHKQLAWLGVELRALAYEMNVAMWTATQTNRGAVSKQTAMGDDIAGDFTKVATCDALISLNQTLKEAEDDAARIFWVKNRVGRKHLTFNVVTDFDRSLIQSA
jgi:replicative DNA helicase